MSAAEIPMIGIVGGIGSGKTTVTDSVQQVFRSQRLDADVTGHRVLKRADIRKQLTDIFGTQILGSDGEISRPALASRVFGNQPDQQAARKSLEQIVHPAIRASLLEEAAQWRASGECDLLFLDAPLLLESGWAPLCDAIVFLDVPQEERLSRVRGRGWSEEDLARREASQMQLEQKRQAADVVIDQSGSLEESTIQLTEWLQKQFPQLQAKNSSQLRNNPENRELRSKSISGISKFE